MTTQGNIRGPKQAKPVRNMFRDMLVQVRRIPKGKVATYGDVAYAAGFPGAARQVAWALHSGSHGLPWHRVIGAGGTILLGGEAGFNQRMRLQGEGVAFAGLKVDIKVHRHDFFRKSGKNQPQRHRATEKKKK
jgi:methylated-DNA-protein-cysteine methyltransferase-like protein